MKRVFYYILPLLFVFNQACEIETTEFHCYPQRVKTTLSTGAGAASTTADYKYTTDKLIDRIIWSNSQTHYFSYDADNQISKVEEYNIKALQETEYRFTYDGDQLMRVDKYLSSLDYLEQQPIDTAYIGYQTFIHEGANVSEEEVYVRKDGSEEFQLKYKKEYTYDLMGNITKLISMDVVKGDTAEAYTFSYDYEKNPYNGLQLFFNGESFINNILEKVDLVKDNTYTYQIIYNGNQYPEQINIKEEGTLYQVMTFDYICD